MGAFGPLLLGGESRIKARRRPPRDFATNYATYLPPQIHNLNPSLDPLITRDPLLDASWQGQRNRLQHDAPWVSYFFFTWFGFCCHPAASCFLPFITVILLPPAFLCMHADASC